MPPKSKSVADPISDSLNAASIRSGAQRKVTQWLDLCPDEHRQAVIDRVLMQPTLKVNNPQAARSLNILAIDFDMDKPPKLTPDSVRSWRGHNLEES